MLSHARRRRWLLLLVVACLAVPGRPLAQSPRGARQLAAVGTADIRDLDAEITRQERTGSLVLRSREADSLGQGRTVARFDQFYRRVRVVGGELVRQEANGQTVSAFGALYPGIALDASPAVSADEAVATLARLTGVRLPASRTPELVVLPLDAGGFALAWRARVMTSSDLVVYFIDARTGDVILQYSNLETAIGSGKGVYDDVKKVSTTQRNGTYVAQDGMRPAAISTYDMKGNRTRLEQILNGQVQPAESDFATDSDNDWTDPATVDAHAYAGWTYDYWYARFNRQGIDNRNRAMLSFVHPVNRDDWSSQPASVINLYYLNAFYAGDGVMVYGEGLPPNVTAGGYRWTYFSAALDVVGHELAHGITDYSSGLIYRNESGALNEAFSDILGAGVEFYYQPVGGGYMKADYLMGEDLMSPIGGFRSMANPAAFGDPDHYSKRYTGTADNGGVHHNSGIVNQAFYLAVEGGVNRTSGLPVTGVGAANRDKMEKVVFRAFTQMLPSNATFSLARAATLQAARDLYGSGSDVERAWIEAWTAVGVQ
jgi:Zn-dependent metalloprotease